jgi:hypothetical protein
MVIATGFILIAILLCALASLVMLNTAQAQTPPKMKMFVEMSAATTMPDSADASAVDAVAPGTRFPGSSSRRKQSL